MTTTTLDSTPAPHAADPFEEEITSDTDSVTADTYPMTASAAAWTKTAAAEAATETAAPEVDSVGPEPTPSEEPAALPETIRILIVDDEMAMRALSQAIVESMGYEAITVSSGEEAIETFSKHQDRDESIQAVIMDLALPGGISGLEATDALRGLNETVRVIASSGYLQQNARAAAIERGFAGILPKPYTAERLTAELRWVVTRGQEEA